MSCSLHWRPVRSGTYVDCGPDLRNAIEEEFGLPYVMSATDVAFLRGLRAAKVDGADILIDLLERHGSIELFKEC